MKPVLPLRIASALTFIHALLHTVGGVFGKTPPGPATTAVLAMKSNQFVALGVSRTLWDYYHGMGLGVSIFLTAEAIVFWQLSTVSKSVGPQLRPIFATFFVGYLVFALDSYLYFFAAPVIVEALISACFLWALIAAKPSAVV
jgi:hypothetical protein